MAESTTPRFGFTKQSAGTDGWPGRAGFMAYLDLIEANAAMFKTGTYAARGAAGKQGRFYWATDTKQLLWDNGAAWEDTTALTHPTGYARNQFIAGDVNAVGIYSSHSASQQTSLRGMTTSGTNAHRLVAPRAGVYRLDATIRIVESRSEDFPGGWSVRDFELAIVKNTSTLAGVLMMEPVSVGREASAWVRQKSVSTVVQLAANDWVTPEVFCHDTGNATVNTPPAFTSISAQLLV